MKNAHILSILLDEKGIDFLTGKKPGALKQDIAPDWAAWNIIKGIYSSGTLTGSAQSTNTETVSPEEGTQ